MKRLLPAIALALAAAVLVGGFALWRRRPGRPVVTVNGRNLSAQELAWRGTTLLNDAIRGEHLAVPPSREREAEEHYRREAARDWIYKQIMVATAVARGVTVSQSDEKEAVARADQKLKLVRNMTLEQYFAEGPMPRELKERDFREGLLAEKFVKDEVDSKIRVTGEEIKARIDELVKRNQAEAKPGGKPKYRTDHKYAADMIRNERRAKGRIELIRSMAPTVQISSPEYPEFESVEGLFSARPHGGGKAGR